MVIASGCGSRNLVRLGEGNLKSLVVLIVMAISAFATLKGITAVVRVATVDRLVLQLRWAEGLSRHETALSLDVQPASVLAAEMRLRAWVQGERDALS